jgi:RNA polymerase sigma-70 factor (ECF subfamily)
MYAPTLSTSDLLGWLHGAARRCAPAWPVARMTRRVAHAPERLSELIVRIATLRDRAAFAEMFDHFAPRVKSYMLRLGAGPTEADDLAQEAMLTIWRKAARFDPTRAGTATWVFTIARNLRIDALRRERSVEPFDGGAVPDVPDEAAGADSAMATAQSEQALRAAFAGLSEEETMLLRMSFLLTHLLPLISVSLLSPLGINRFFLKCVLSMSVGVKPWTMKFLP